MVDIAQSLIASGSFSDDDKRSKSKYVACRETSQRLALSSTLCKQEGTFTQSAWHARFTVSETVSMYLGLFMHTW